MTQFEKFKHIILGADYLKSSNLLTGMVGIQTLVSDWYYIKHLNLCRGDELFEINFRLR